VRGHMGRERGRMGQGRDGGHDVRGHDGPRVHRGLGGGPYRGGLQLLVQLAPIRQSPEIFQKIIV
jgi:hypothetical protein